MSNDIRQPTVTPQFLTVDEVAETFRTSRDALYVQRHRGEGIGSLAVKVGKRLLWRRSDLDSWYDAQLGRL